MNLQTAASWRSDAPPVGEVVEVWYVNSVILAYFDGDGWRTTEGGRLSLVSYWRRRFRG